MIMDFKKARSSNNLYARDKQILKRLLQVKREQHKIIGIVKLILGIADFKTYIITRGREMFYSIRKLYPSQMCTHTVAIEHMNQQLSV